MRKWEATLRRDSEVWADFLAWLAELRAREVDTMLVVDAAHHDLQRGVVKGIDVLIYAARSAEREEQALAARR